MDVNGVDAGGQAGQLQCDFDPFRGRLNRRRAHFRALGVLQNGLGRGGRFLLRFIFQNRIQPLGYQRPSWSSSVQQVHPQAQYHIGHYAGNDGAYRCKRCDQPCRPAGIEYFRPVDNEDDLLWDAGPVRSPPDTGRFRDPVRIGIPGIHTHG